MICSLIRSNVPRRILATGLPMNTVPYLMRWWRRRGTKFIWHLDQIVFSLISDALWSFSRLCQKSMASMIVTRCTVNIGHVAMHTLDAMHSAPRIVRMEQMKQIAFPIPAHPTNILVSYRIVMTSLAYLYPGATMVILIAWVPMIKRANARLHFLHLGHTSIVAGTRRNVFR